MKAKFGEDKVIRIVPELTWKENGSTLFYKKFRGYKPVIITRNYMEMLESAYHYYYHFRIERFKDYVKNTSWKDYETEIKKFVTFDPIVLSLEEMRKNPQFTHENKNLTKKRYAN